MTTSNDGFGATVCKTVRPMLSDRCLSVLSVLSVLTVCNVRALWPNGWTDQDEAWQAGRPQPWPHCVRCEPSFPSSKGAQPPIFGPYLLRPNGCMDQDVTWYGGRPRSTRNCVRCGSSYPQKKGTPTPNQFLSHVYCGHGRPSQILLSSCIRITQVDRYINFY